MAYFTRQIQSMDLFLPTPSAKRAATRPAWFSALRQAAAQRTRVGFTVGEAFVWFAFVAMWPTILGSIYFLGGIFQSGKAMPVDQFILTSLVVAVTKALVIIPVWWVYFVKLKHVTLRKRVLLHPLTGALYAAACVGIVYFVKVYFLAGIGSYNVIVSKTGGTRVLPTPYPVSAALIDYYNLLSSYVMNFMVFHAYNFWLSSQQQKKREQEIKDLAFQSEINALKTQIEPHFLFNTLNSISASVPPTLENTRVLIAQLADTFRYALRVSERQFVTLGEELEFLKTWLALEQHRFGKRLTVHYRLDENALHAMVPPMLLQPLVENALNHGIAHRVEGGTVTVECLVTERNNVLVSVRDTGVGYAGDLDQLITKGVGLSNTAKRLQLLYNEQIRIERLPQGLSFSFHLPLTPLHETARIDY